MDHMGFGFIACRELMPDLWELADAVPEALAELTKALNGSSSSAPAKKTAAKKTTSTKAEPTKAEAKRTAPKKTAKRAASGRSRS
jgi:hypothetical protein